MIFTIHIGGKPTILGKPPFPPNFFVTLFGMVKTWPFSKVVGDLQLGEEKKRSLWITWDLMIFLKGVFFKWISFFPENQTNQKHTTQKRRNEKNFIHAGFHAKGSFSGFFSRHVLDEGCQVFFSVIIFNKRWTHHYLRWFGRKCRFAVSALRLILILLVFPSHLQGTNRISEIQNCTMHGILEKSKSRLNSGSGKIGVFTDVVSDWMRC